MLESWRLPLPFNSVTKDYAYAEAGTVPKGP